MQKLVNPDKIIKIPEPKYDTGIDFEGIKGQTPDDEKDDDWETILDRVKYDRERWVISRTGIDSVVAKELKNKRLEILGGVSDCDFDVSGELKLDILKDLFKNTLLSISAELLQESGFGSMNRGKLYRVILKHISEKIFSGKSLLDTSRDDIEFAIDVIPEIRENFTNSIVAGILES